MVCSILDVLVVMFVMNFGNLLWVIMLVIEVLFGLVVDDMVVVWVVSVVVLLLV